MNVYTQIREKGAVTRGWLGVLIQDVTRELAESFKMSKPHGALVSKVLPDSPASAAGFKPGDVIVKFNNRPIDISAELPPLVGTAPVGEKTPVEVIRAGGRKTLQVEIGELPGDDEVQLANAPKAKQNLNKRLKLSVRDLTNTERDGSDVSGGVIVDRVEEGPAYDAGLRPGDILLQINSRSVDSSTEFREIVKELKAGTSVPVLVHRQGGPLFLAMKIPGRG
jgi:serine protease Do